MKKQIKKIRVIDIFDVDGVLLDSSHRYRTIKDESGNKRIDLKYWRENEPLCYKDELLPHANTFKKSLNAASHLCLIATAREMKKADFDMIYKFLGVPDGFVYRPIGCSTKGHILKIEGVDSFLQTQGINASTRKIRIFEDNATYLKAMCDYFNNAIGHYIPSKQGH